MKIIETKDLITEKEITLSSSSLISKDIEPILCDHCLRTASNGIRCLGICVADNEY